MSKNEIINSTTINDCQLFANLRKKGLKKGRKLGKEGLVKKEEEEEEERERRGKAREVEMRSSLCTENQPWRLLPWRAVLRMLRPCVVLRMLHLTCTTTLFAVLCHLWCWIPEEKAGVSKADCQRPASPPR